MRYCKPDIAIKPQYYPIPIPWHMMGGSPLLVEIGFGRGEFLLSLAREYPAGLIVGFEVSMTSLLKACGRLKSEGVRNVKLVLFDAVFGLREFFSPSSVDGVYMNFPVPWPKKKHAKRRIVNPPFWRILANVLKPGGFFDLMTDVEWYALEAAENSKLTGFFEVRVEKNPKRRVQTKYEQKWISEGRDIFRVIAQKISGSTADVERLLVAGGDYMPHAVMKGYFDPVVLRGLEGSEVSWQRGTFGVREVYVRERDALLRAYTIDDGFFQSFYVWFRPYSADSDDLYLLKLDPLTSPFRTKSLLALMAFIRDRLASAGFSVLRDNLRL